MNDISARLTKINQNYEEVKGELNDANCKIEEIESTMQNQVQQIGAMHERLPSIEFYSREYNLRFHNIPESPGEDCRQEISYILTEQLKLEPKIENVHRVGPSIADKPRAIICKFIYRPERFKVLQRKRDPQNNVWITEDLIWEDREKKKKLKDVMKKTYKVEISHVFIVGNCI